MPIHVILKTQWRQYRNVLRFAKHATDKPPTLIDPGAVILIHCEAQGQTIPPRVTHAMDCVRIYPDETGETERIWGRRWNFVIEGSNLRKLTVPIPISRFGNASGKNYGQCAQKFIYVEDADLEDLRSEGLL